MQVKDLNTLISIKGLKHLAKEFKATNIKFLNKIENIGTLIFDDTPKISTLSLYPIKLNSSIEEKDVMVIGRRKCL